MSEESTTTATATESKAADETSTTEDAKPLRLPDDHPLVKTLAAQKAELKEAKAKAARLDEIEEANKTEAQRAAERLAAAEQTAREAEARAVRREIALDHRLSKEDAALLDGMTDEDAMRRLAERLAKAAQEDEAPVGFRVDNSGRKSNAKPNKDDAARVIFGI